MKDYEMVVLADFSTFSKRELLELYILKGGEVLNRTMEELELGLNKKEFKDLDIDLGSVLFKIKLQGVK
jgi:hypothetical protein